MENKVIMENKEFKHIVRIANTDLNGNKKVVDGLRKVKGISFMFSNMICSLANINKHEKIGNLSESDINKLDEAIRNPLKFDAPVWMLNRRREYETNDNLHLVAADVKFVQDNDIKIMKKIKSYRGVRHILGLPVRGQRTKSNFRRNKGKVLGVKRRATAKPGKT